MHLEKAGNCEEKCSLRQRIILTVRTARGSKADFASQSYHFQCDAPKSSEGGLLCPRTRCYPA
jgi:hypothetical protein